MSGFRTLAGLLGAALTATFVHAAPAAATTIPDAEVRIQKQAYEGPRGTILASLRARCAPGFEVSDLIVEFSQGTVVTPPQVIPTSFSCDGAWHLVRLTSLEAFEPGPATLRARLSVTDVVFGDPGEDGFQVQQIYVRPAARVILPKSGVLTSPGVVKIVVLGRCDRPWVLSDFIVFASQGRVGNQSVDTRLLSIPCDGEFHRVPVWLVSDTTRPFRRGWVRVTGTIDLVDPEFFDPVTQATRTRGVLVE